MRLATIAPNPKNKAKATNELTDNCIIPLKPCPLGQPSLYELARKLV